MHVIGACIGIEPRGEGLIIRGVVFTQCDFFIGDGYPSLLWGCHFEQCRFPCTLEQLSFEAKVVRDCYFEKDCAFGVDPQIMYEESQLAVKRAKPSLEATIKAAVGGAAVTGTPVRISTPSGTIEIG